MLHVINTVFLLIFQGEKLSLDGQSKAVLQYAPTDEVSSARVQNVQKPTRWNVIDVCNCYSVMVD